MLIQSFFSADVGELHVIPERAKELVSELVTEVLDPCWATRLLISWIMRSYQYYELNDDDEQDNEVLDSDLIKAISETNFILKVFGYVENNPYSEDEPLRAYATTVLKKFLWKLDNGLSYDDYSIFIEEHTLLVATKVRNAMYRGPIPFVPHHIRCTIVQILRKMIEFLEVRDIGKPNFKSDLDRELVNYTTRFFIHNDDEDTRNKLKYLLKCIFGLI